MKKFISAEQIFQKKLWSMVCSEPNIKDLVKRQEEFLERGLKINEGNEI